MRALILKNEAGEFYQGSSPFFIGEVSFTNNIQEATIVNAMPDDHERFGLTIAADLTPLPQNYASLMERLIAGELSAMELRVIRFFASKNIHQ